MYGITNRAGTQMAREGLPRQEVQDLAWRNRKVILPRDPAAADLAPDNVVIITVESPPAGTPRGARVTLLPAVKEGGVWIKRHRVDLPTAADIEGARAEAKATAARMFDWFKRLQNAALPAVEQEINRATTLDQVVEIRHRYELP